MVCDRYLASTLVLQQFDGVPEQYLLDLNRGILLPSLAVILTAPPGTVAAPSPPAAPGTASTPTRPDPPAKSPSTHAVTTLGRIGFFFEATTWVGEPVNREPEKCLSLEWFSVHELPDDIIEYPQEGIASYLNGSSPLAEHGWTDTA